LDEPTNDLDIPTLDVLEENLLEFPGALVLVTHDRFMMDRVSTVVLGLDGLGNSELFADYAQWETWQRLQEAGNTAQRERDSTKPTIETASPSPKRKLSYLDAREFAGIEQRIANVEATLDVKLAELNDPAIASDAARLVAISAEIDEARKLVDSLYARWAE